MPGSQGEFFDEMMNQLEADPENYPYYSHLIDDLGMTGQQVYMYAYGQKKLIF
uniref:CAZy families PL1/CE8 protein n=1 Tax=uncultured organism TaxID=155900 RepID=A0A060BNA7_9ZZZZ|nr:CAZy families PL1/CE8 protein [uncultured organism]